MILLTKSVNRIVNNPQEGNSGMVNRRRDKDYIRKVIRISQNYIVLCDFLDFYAGYKEKNKFDFYNDLFNYSLSKISGDIGYKFKKPSGRVYGITRSFFLNKKTYDLFNTIYNKSKKLYRSLYDDYLSLGNFTELILYIYITDNIDKKILNLFKLDFGIKKIT
ncbi:MAG: hypothetical protein ISS14_02720 [Actinobacteria bacterium]|nr:hypothetical protein [Actinomycetota bacterium]MBL7123786.1 hypothetical protein [Actinomycetota bacterium]